MAKNDLPGLAQQTLHTNVWGNAGRAVVKVASGVQTADDSQRVMCLPTGMRVDKVTVWVTDAGDSGEDVDIGYATRDDVAATKDEDYWFNNQGVNATGRFESAAVPYEIEHEDTFLEVKWNDAITAANTVALTIMVDYVFVGND